MQGYKEVTILPGDKYWPMIAQAIKHPDMQFESKNGEDIKMNVTSRNEPNINFHVIVKFVDELQSTFDIYKKKE